MAEIDYSQIEFTIEFSYCSAILSTSSEYEYNINDNGWSQTSNINVPQQYDGVYIRVRLAAGQTATGGWPFTGITGTIGNFDIYGNVKSLYANDMSTVGDTQPCQLKPVGQNDTTSKSFAAKIKSAKNLIIPFKTLVQDGLKNYFNGCRLLNYAPALPAEVVPQGAYYQMFYNCSQLKEPPQVFNIKTCGVNCCMYMFSGCKQLTNAPVINGATAAQGCFANMFYNCTALKKIEIYNTNLNAVNSTLNWVYGVESGGEFWCDNTISFAHMGQNYGVNSVPDGWAKINVDSTYTITWKIDGETVYTETHKYGTEITSSPEVEEQIGYTFSGWDKTLPFTLTEDTIINGAYTVNNYTITWKIDDEVIHSESHPYNTEITSAPEVEEEIGYTFSWDKTLPFVLTEDTTINGSYTLNYYTLTWKIDDEVIQSESLPYNTEITSAPEVEDKVGYSFSWDKTLPFNLTEDTTVSGSYTVNYYTLTWKIDDEVIYTESHPYNTEITSSPEVEEQIGYTFSGWDKTLPFVLTEDTIINGSYTVNYYTIYWRVDGEVISTATYNYGDSVEQVNPDAPEKTGYKFTGWVPALPSTMPAHDVYINAEYIESTGPILTDNLVAREKLVNISDSTNIRRGNLLQTLPYGDVEEIEIDGETIHAQNWHVITPDGVYRPTNYYIQCFAIQYTIDGEDYQTVYQAPGSEITPISAPEKEHFEFLNYTSYPSTMPKSDIIIDLKYKQVEYKLEYLVDGTVDETLWVKVGDEIPAYDKEKTGYIITVYSSDTEEYEVMPAKNLQLYVVYVASKYNLIFNDEDGDVLYTYKFGYNEIINVNPSAPTKTGYSFSGWTNLPETMPMEDVICTPTYTINTYTLTYYINGTVYLTKQYEYQAVIEEVVPEISDDYIFDGWQGLPSDMLMPAYNLNVSTQLIGQVYTLTWQIDGEVVRVDAYNAGDKIIVYNYDLIDGYTFAWQSEIPATMPAENLIINGVYTKNVYRLRYIALGEVLFTNNIEYQAQITHYVLDEADYPDYDFKGWINYPSDGLMPPYNLDIIANLVAKDSQTYTLTWQIDGTVVRVDTYNEGDIINVYNYEIKAGYSFEWQSEIPETMPAENLIINGVYTKNVYRLRYIALDEVLLSENIEYQAQIPDYELNEADYPDYNFKGWLYYPSDGLMPAYNLDLVADLVEEAVYTLTYIIDNQVVKEEKYTYGEVITPYVPEEREGYTFSWINEAPETMPAENVEVYGQYTANEYTITWYALDNIVHTSTQKYGEVISLYNLDMESDEYKEYTFNGWTGLPANGLMPAYDLSLYADLVEITYKVYWYVDNTLVRTDNYKPGTIISNTPVIPQKTGYIILGWSQDIPFTMPENDLVINAVYDVLYDEFTNKPFTVEILPGSGTNISICTNVRDLILSKDDGETWTSVEEWGATAPTTGVYDRRFVVNEGDKIIMYNRSKETIGTAYEPVLGYTNTSTLKMKLSGNATHLFTNLSTEPTGIMTVRLWSADMTDYISDVKDLRLCYWPGLSYNNLFKNLNIEYPTTRLYEAAATDIENFAGSFYYRLFYNCVNLKTIPYIPDIPDSYQTKLRYSWMFQGCTSLTRATLYQNNLYSGIYQAMFWECSNLNYVTLYATDIQDGATDSWLYGVAETGILRCHKNIYNKFKTELRTSSTYPVGWTAAAVGYDDSIKELTIKDLNTGETLHTQTYINGQWIDDIPDYGTPPTPHHHLDGYLADVNGDGNLVMIDYPYAVTSDLTLYPTYETMYRVNYYIWDRLAKTEYYDVGETITVYQPREYDGYTFEWTTDIPSTMPAQNLSIYGEYTKTT